MKKIVIYILLVISLISPTIFSAGADIEKKIAMETNLENRLKSVLTEITGTDKLIVIVSIQMVTEKDKKEVEKKTEILPGVPFEGKIGDVISSSLQSMDLGTERSLIKKITATIILDKAIPKTIEETAKQVTIGLLGIDEVRGDQLIIQKMSFQKNPFYWGDIIKPPHLYYVFGLVSFFILVIFSILFFFGPFQKRIGSIAKAIEENAKAGNKSEGEFSPGANRTMTPIPGMLPGESQNTGSRTSETKEKKPFEFVTSELIPNIIHTLKTETPDNIAIVVNYLSSETAIKVLSGLSENIQVEVLKKLITKKEYGRDEILEMELKIKEKADYTIGGSDRLSDIVSNLDEKIYSNFSNLVRKENPQVLTNLEKMLVKITDIASFSGEEISIIIRGFGLSGFAQILKNSPEISNSIIQKLPKGIQDRLKQEIEFAKPIPQKRLQIEKTRLVNIIKSLISEGLISEIKR